MPRRALPRAPISVDCKLICLRHWAKQRRHPCRLRRSGTVDFPNCLRRRVWSAAGTLLPKDDGTGAAVRGHIQLNESVPVTPSRQLQEEGITARIQLDALNLDAWYTSVRPVYRAIEDTGQPDLLGVYWTNRIQAKISALTLKRRQWQNLMLDAVRRAPQPEDTPARASIWQIDALRVDNPDAQMQAHG